MTTLTKADCQLGDLVEFPHRGRWYVGRVVGIDGGDAREVCRRLFFKTIMSSGHYRLLRKDAADCRKTSRAFLGMIREAHD